MKKTIILGAALAAVAGSAAAQSSVTLFGVIDANVRYAKSDLTNTKQVGTDGLSASRIGVRGTEDLGGGLKAGFWLEGALQADTGTADASKFWGRRATVSLSSVDFGEIRIGRAKNVTRLLIDGFTPFETTGTVDITKAYTTFGKTVNTTNRSDNQVAYTLPENLGGVYGGLDVGAGEGADGSKYYAGRVGYKDKELNVAAAYSTTDVAGDKYKVGVLGASYDFGVATAMGTVGQTQFGSMKQTVYTVAGVVPVTAEGSIRAQYARNSANDAAVAGAKVYNLDLFSIGYVHNLSKRTGLYTNYSLINNKGNGTVTLATAPAATAGGKSQALEVGVRHSF